MRLEVGGAAELRAVSRRLAAAGRGDLRRELQRAVSRNVEPLVADVRAAARALPSSGRYNTGLRNRIAGAVQFEPRADRTSITVDRARMPAGKGGLPAAMDKTRFRHPVFGTDRWVTQRSRPWFKRPIKAQEARLAAAVQAAVDRLAAELER